MYDWNYSWWKVVHDVVSRITSSLTDNRVVVHNNKRRKYSLSKKEAQADSVNLIALTMILNLHFLW